MGRGVPILPVEWGPLRVPIYIHEGVPIIPVNWGPGVPKLPVELGRGAHSTGSLGTPGPQNTLTPVQIWGPLT